MFIGLEYWNRKNGYIGVCGFFCVGGSKYIMSLWCYLSKPTVLSMHVYCFSYLNGFFQNVLHAFLSPKTEFIEHRLTFSDWLGMITDDVNYV